MVTNVSMVTTDFSIQTANGIEGCGALQLSQSVNDYFTTVTHRVRVDGSVGYMLQFFLHNGIMYCLGNCCIIGQTEYQ